MRISKFCDLKPLDKFIIGPPSAVLPMMPRFDTEYDYVLMQKITEGSVVIYHNGLLIPKIDCLSAHPVIRVWA